MKTSQHNIKLPLDKLILRLTNAGFKIDVRLRIKMHKALSQLGRKYLEKPEDLGLILCPLVAKSKAEQELFESVFKAYIDDNEFYISGPGSDGTGTTVVTPLLPRLLMWIGVGLAIAFIAIYLCWISFTRTPVVNFRVSDTTVQVGDVVYIKNLTSVLLDDSTREQYGYSWEIDGKQVIDDLNLSYVFVKPGTAKIRLQVWRLKNKKRSGLLEKKVEVICEDKLQVVFEDFPESGDTNSSLSFSAQILPNPEKLKFSWDFGDGAISTEYTPTHTFTNPGIYEVRLDVSRSGSSEEDVCDRASVTQYISIGNDNNRVVLSEEPRREVSEIREAKIAYWVLILLFSVCPACYMIYEWRRHRRVHSISERLRIKYTPSDKPPITIPFPLQDDAITPEPEFLAFTDSLRERQEGEQYKLDIPATLRATIRRAGFAELRYKQTSKPAEYLFLIDEVSPDSQQFKLFEHMAKSLSKEDVIIKTFFYRSNPSVLWNKEFPDGLRIQELHRLYPDYRLVVIGNGHYLVDPVGGQISQHTYRLYELWQQRALLTSVTPDKWGYKERLLKDLFVLLPADVRGQCLLVESFQRKGQPEFKVLHHDLMARAKRTAEIPRSSKNLNLKKLKNLKAFLGEDLFKWLAATVVYPYPTWEIMLAVGNTLSPHLVNYDNILTMSHVPWLQTGAIPRKLRKELLAALKDMDRDERSEVEKTARKTVISLLTAALDNLQTMSNESIATCDLNKELTLQRAAFDKEDMEAQQELQYLLESGKIDQKNEALINHKLIRKPKPSGLALRAAICLVPWAIMCAALSIVEMTHAPLGPSFERDVVINSDKESTATYNTLVDKYNKAVNIYNKGEFNTAIEDFEVVSNADGADILKNKARHGIGLSRYYIGEKDSAKKINELLLSVGFYDDWVTSNLNTLFAVGENNNVVEQLLNSMVLVEGGCFEMGDTFGGGYGSERPVHQVCIKNFYMSKYEVTQGQWEALMGNNPSDFKQGDNYPVESVSWDDVQIFIERFNQETGKDYRLPTEAEWEYAARSGGKSEKYSGFSNDDDLYLYANFCDSNCGFEERKDDKQNDGYRNTSPVGSFRPNGIGIYDMSGNVWEWCQDWYDREYYKNSPVNDPIGPETGTGRVVRGGGWGDGAGDCRSSIRGSGGPSDGDYVVGFRLVLPQAISVKKQVEKGSKRSPEGTRDKELEVRMLDEAERKLEYDSIKKQQDELWENIPELRKQMIVGALYDRADDKTRIILGKEIEVWKRAAFIVTREGEIRIIKPVNEIELIEIPAGDFLMGGHDDDKMKYDDEKPQHKVIIEKSFYMQKTEVTQGQWDAIMGSNPSASRQGDDYPVEGVSWDDVQEFIMKLNNQNSKNYRLPTEAEWEYAARAETKTMWYCGDNEVCLNSIAWYEANAEDKTHPVGTKQPNNWGLYDMSGNVWEWCQDWYDSEYYKNSPVNDPIGPETGSYRVVRGGGWDGGARYCRSSIRDDFGPSNGYNSVGFRLVLPQAISEKKQVEGSKRSPEVTRDEELEVRSAGGK